MRGLTLLLLLAGSVTAVQHKESTSFMSRTLSHVQVASDRLVQAEEKLPTSARYVISTLEQGTMMLIPGLNLLQMASNRLLFTSKEDPQAAQESAPTENGHEGDWRDEWRNPEAGETTAADSDTKQELVGDWRTEYGPNMKGSKPEHK
nr:unknown [Amphidinium carterae]ABV22088.1 unknown [Amphidinium carterae]ABV22089.1 unknown [Amphidinium carterae]